MNGQNSFSSSKSEKSLPVQFVGSVGGQGAVKLGGGKSERGAVKLGTIGMGLQKLSSHTDVVVARGSKGPRRAFSSLRGSTWTVLSPTTLVSREGSRTPCSRSCDWHLTLATGSCDPLSGTSHSGQYSCSR